MAGFRTIAALDIMIIDDNAPIRALVRSILRAVGVRKIRDASDARDALEQLEFQPADLLLLDHAMPGMTGLDMVRILRADPDHPAARARIVMMTGYGDRKHVAAARDAGVDEFLVKPLSTRTLLQRIESALRHRRPFVDAQGFHGPDRRRRRTSTPPNGAERRAEDTELV
jgi:CheY-like chemotaxis protein